MSQSFNNKVGSRLRGYEPTPPPHLKKKVISALPSNGLIAQVWQGINVWQLIGICSIGVGLFFFYRPEQLQIITQNSNFKDIETSIEPIWEETIGREPMETVGLEIASTSEIVEIKTLTKTVDRSSVRDRGVPSSQVFSTQIEEEVNTQKKVDLVPYSPKIGYRKLREKELNTPFLAFDLRRNEQIAPIKPADKGKLPFYVESGLFFIYQQVQPNVEDDWVINSFEGESGLSPKRLGFRLEPGVYWRIGQRVRIHTGVSFSTFQQSYRFTLREFTPSSLTLSQPSLVDESVFTPIYEADKISVNHRLYTLGGNMEGSFGIFPSPTNELIAGLSYHRVLNPTHQIDMQEEELLVRYNHQFLLTVGFRKRVLETQKGFVQLVPSIRYSLQSSEASGNELFSMKPYSMGLSISYIFGNFHTSK